MHLDKHLNALILTYQLWTYLILFAVIFCETGLVVTPFLPGDSLLFAAGALAATPGSPLQVHWLFLILTAAAILGDTVNYWIGHAVGPKIFRQKKIRFLKKSTWSAPTSFTKNTAARPSSWPASSPSSAPSPRSWPASGA